MKASAVAKTIASRAAPQVDDGMTTPSTKGRSLSQIAVATLPSLSLLKAIHEQSVAAQERAHARMQEAVMAVTRARKAGSRMLKVIEDKVQAVRDANLIASAKAREEAEAKRKADIIARAEAEAAAEAAGMAEQKDILKRKLLAALETARAGTGLQSEMLASKEAAFWSSPHKMTPYRQRVLEIAQQNNQGAWAAFREEVNRDKPERLGSFLTSEEGDVERREAERALLPSRTAVWTTEPAGPLPIDEPYLKEVQVRPHAARPWRAAPPQLPDAWSPSLDGWAHDGGWDRVREHLQMFGINDEPFRNQMQQHERQLEVTRRVRLVGVTLVEPQLEKDDGLVEDAADGRQPTTPDGVLRVPRTAHRAAPKTPSGVPQSARAHRAATQMPSGVHQSARAHRATQMPSGVSQSARPHRPAPQMPSGVPQSARAHRAAPQMPYGGQAMKVPRTPPHAPPSPSSPRQEHRKLRQANLNSQTLLWSTWAGNFAPSRKVRPVVVRASTGVEMGTWLRSLGDDGVWRWMKA